MGRKKHTKEFKSKVAVAAIKGHQTVNEIASEFGIHTGLVTRWKKEALESLPAVFGNTKAKAEKEAEKETDRLHQKIGKLQVEIEWLKKNLGEL